MNKRLLSVMLVIAATTIVSGVLDGTWPPINSPPPPVPSWTALVNKQLLPNAPVRNPPFSCDPVDSFCFWPCTACTRSESDVYYCPKQNDWALTYDDGPTPFTLTVLEQLKARGLKATFFAIGSRVYENPTILQQIVKDGHQVGVHTWSHTALTTQTTDEIIAEIKWTELAIKKAIGLTPKWMRPPQGDYDDRVRGIMTQLGYKIAIWNHDTFDWKSNTDPTYDLNWIPDNFTIWAMNKTSPIGVMSLEHDAFNTSSSKAASAMDIVLKYNYNVKQVSNCLGIQSNPPYIESSTLPDSSPSPLPPPPSSTSTAKPLSLPSPSSSPKSNAVKSTRPQNILSITVSIMIITTLIFI